MDTDTFCAAVEEHQGMLFRVARSILATDEDAEDAVQEALSSAFQHRSRIWQRPFPSGRQYPLSGRICAFR